jgi:hypothetical protein
LHNRRGRVKVFKVICARSMTLRRTCHASTERKPRQHRRSCIRHRAEVARQLTLASPQGRISKIKSWPSITAMSFRRDGGETIWRGDRPTGWFSRPAGAPTRSSKGPRGKRCPPRLALSGFILPALQSGAFKPQRGPFSCSGIRICIPPCRRSSGRPYPVSDSCVRSTILVEPNRHGVGRGERGRLRG